MVLGHRLFVGCIAVLALLRALTSVTLISKSTTLLDRGIDMPSANLRSDKRWTGFQPLRDATNFEAWVMRARAAVETQVVMAAVNRSTRGVIDYAAAHALEQYFCGRTGGVALELGGLDGFTWSESRVMASAMDMARVVIDGNPVHRLRRIERSPDAVGVEAAVCNTSGTLHFVASGPTSGIAEFMSDKYLKTFFPQLLEARKAAADNWLRIDWFDSQAKLGLKAPPHEVICTPLQHILDHLRLTHINLVVLDTEGSELQILKTIDWRQTRFDILVIEANATTSQPGYPEAVARYIRSASHGNYVVASSRTRGVRGRDIWMRHRDFRPASCRGLFSDSPISIAVRGFEVRP